jgi:hypothetical protein
LATFWVSGGILYRAYAYRFKCKLLVFFYRLGYHIAVVLPYGILRGRSVGGGGQCISSPRKARSAFQYVPQKDTPVGWLWYQPEIVAIEAFTVLCGYQRRIDMLNRMSQLDSDLLFDCGGGRLIVFVQEKIWVKFLLRNKVVFE